MGGFGLVARAANETGHDADCGADRSAEHHILEQYLTRHVREQSRTPADKRSEYQADESEADEIAG